MADDYEEYKVKEELAEEAADWKQDSGAARKRRLDRKKKKRRLEKTKYAFRAGRTDARDHYLKPFKNSTRQGFYKKIANKKVRKASDRYDHGDYRRVYDYKWSVD